MSSFSKVASSQFDIIHKNPRVWFNKADQLEYTSFILRKRCISANNKFEKLCKNKPNGFEISKEMKFDLQCYQEATMLFSLAIENVLKGIWIIKNGKKLEGNIKKLQKVLQTHDLVLISHEINIDFNSNDLELLNNFTEFIKWRGRYPIPINSQGYIEHFESKSIKKFIENKKNKLPLDIESLWKKLIETRDNLLKKEEV